MQIERPYEHVCDWAEDIFPHTGKKVFSILSLMIPSLILPDLPYKGQKIRSNINSIFLAPPGAGKTAISKIFASLTYNPLRVGSITSARLESELKKMEYGSFIVGDFARMSKDQIVIKTIEGIFGEEKEISRKTMVADHERETEIIGLLCGVPSDLTNHLTSGLIFRVCPIIIFHSSEEHSRIGKYINDNIGEEDADSKNDGENIKKYYEELLEIQTGDHDNIKPISGYILSDDIKEKIYEKWDNLTFKAVKDTRLNFFRELQEAYRFLVSHAFLNIFDREIEEDRIIPNDEDLSVALKLMSDNIILKVKLLQYEGFVKNLKSIKQLNKILEDKRLNDTEKGILKSLARKS